MYIDLLLVGLVFAFIGLRTYYVIFNWELFRGRPWWQIAFDLRGGGLAIYGGIIGAVLAGVYIAWRRRVPFRLIADTGAPSLLMGQFIGRFGNFFNAEAFGGYTDNLFAMRIRVDRAAYTTPELMERALVANGATYIQVHPTFFYEAAFNLVWMLFLLLYRPYKKFDGEIVYLYFLGYGIARFFIEGLRTDQLIFFNTGLPASQVVSVIFIIISLGALLMGHMRARRPVPAKRRRRRK
jgi:phosphatidylglycerol:prolipoprotein diacylglycerol transferase